MKLIKCLSHYMEDEICGATEYAKVALEYQYDKPALAKLFYQMAQTEYNHYSQLHEQTVKIIEDIQTRGLIYPQKMYDKWEAKHKEMIEKAEDAQIFINMYK